ncbi:hypothetical protein L9F63_012887, partial [Diploptera punctata]
LPQSLIFSRTSLAGRVKRDTLVFQHVDVLSTLHYRPSHPIIAQTVTLPHLKRSSSFSSWTRIVDGRNATTHSTHTTFYTAYVI